MKYSTTGGLVVLMVLAALVAGSKRYARHHSDAAIPAAAIRPHQAGEVQSLTERWKQAAGDRGQLEAVMEAARGRRDAFVQLMVEDPAEAMEQAISVAQYVALPEELKPYYERSVSGRGDVDLLWESHVNCGAGCRHYNTVTLNGERYRANGAGMHQLPVMVHAPLAGIALGGQMVVRSAGLQRLLGDDVDAALELFPLADHGGRDPLSGQELDHAHAALIDGEVHLFASEDSLSQVEAILNSEFTADGGRSAVVVGKRLTWLAGNVGGNSLEGAATPFLPDHINVLFIRVDFSDFPGEPVSQVALSNVLDSVDTQIQNFSYGAASVTHSVSSICYRMPSTGTSYAVAGDNDGIQADARLLAAANYTLGDYDVIGVIFPSLAGVANSLITYDGLASVGGDKHWLNGSANVSLITHELGHNYGLNHANYLHPEEELVGDYELPGVLEYGDIFDIMGQGDAPEADMNMFMKNQLGWLPDTKVTEVMATGEYTIYRFDHPDALNNPQLALKLPMAGDVNYWLGYRQNFPSNSYNLSNAVYVVGDHLGEPGETCLIDMSPESDSSEIQDRRDAGLAVGASFSDPGAGVAIQTIEKGGTAPNEWIKVYIGLLTRIRVADTAITVDEQRGIAQVVVERQLSSAGEVTVNYSTADGTATADSDYYAVSGTLTWAHGDSSTRTIVVPIRPDVVSEGLENFTLSLTGVVGAVLDGAASTCTVSLAEPGMRMTDFDPAFFNTAVQTVVSTADGKVLIGGVITDIFESGGTRSIRNLARLNADGSVDTDFLTGTGFNGMVNVIVEQDDGRILVGGVFTTYHGTSCNRLVRLNLDGTVDASFVAAMGTAANNDVQDIAIEADGGIVVVGAFTSFAGSSCSGIVRLTSGGARDTTAVINPSFIGFDRILSVIAEPDGKVTIAGSFYHSSSGSGFRSGVVRLHADGTRDTSFEPDAGAHLLWNTSSLRTVYDIVRLGNGQYVIGGNFTAYDEHAVSYCARVNADGSFDSTFTPPAFNDWVVVLMEQASGDVLAGGWFTSPAARVERLTVTGAVDASFNQGSGAGNPVFAFAQSDDGSILMGGNFFSYAGLTSRPIIQLVGGQSPYDQWVRVHFTAAQISNGDAEAAADPDDDGRENALEMALGTNPNLAETQTPFAVAPEDGVALASSDGEEYLVVSMDKPVLTAGAWFVAQFSSDMANWLPAMPDPGFNPTYDVVENSGSRFTVRDKSPVSANAKRYCRIKVVLPE